MSAPSPNARSTFSAICISNGRILVRTRATVGSRFPLNRSRAPAYSLVYCPHTGKISRASDPEAKQAGCVSPYGYIVIRVGGGKSCFAHRLAWFLYYGEWPDGQIDHKNGVRHDNRIENLRIAEPGENNQNKRVYKNNKTGLIGVSFAQGKYRAEICIGGKRKYLGRFDTPDEAHAAYLAAKSIYHPFQPTLRGGELG